MLGNGRGGVLSFSWAFMGISWMANYWAGRPPACRCNTRVWRLYVVAEAVLFAPMLYVAGNFGPPNVIATAGLVTAIIFVGLTAAVFITKADFSWMGMGLAVAGFAAIGVVVCSLIFGFNLGILFTGAMILFAGGYILYDTSNVLHHYRIGQHVAASLALFASVALLFWYILRLLMSLNRR